MHEYNVGFRLFGATLPVFCAFIFYLYLRFSSCTCNSAYATRNIFSLITKDALLLATLWLCLCFNHCQHFVFVYIWDVSAHVLCTTTTTTIIVKEKCIIDWLCISIVCTEIKKWRRRRHSYCKTTKTDDKSDNSSGERAKHIPMELILASNTHTRLTV